MNGFQLAGRRRIGLPADEPGLPRRHRRDAGHFLDLALRRTGLVVSGVEATSIRSTLSWTIRSLATSAARFGLDWLSLTMTSIGRVALPILMPPWQHPELVEDEIVGLGEGRQRPGLRADIAELDRRVCAMAGIATPAGKRGAGRRAMISAACADQSPCARSIVMMPPSLKYFRRPAGPRAETLTALPKLFDNRTHVRFCDSFNDVPRGVNRSPVPGAHDVTMTVPRGHRRWPRQGVHDHAGQGPRRARRVRQAAAGDDPVGSGRRSPACRAPPRAGCCARSPSSAMWCRTAARSR